MPITYETLKNDDQVRSYILAGNDALNALGFTEHSFDHLHYVAENAALIILNEFVPFST